MNIQEIYELGLEQGWDEDDAFYLATIAWAESKGDPYAMEYLPDNDPDKQYSFGIWQINLQHIQNLIDAGIGDWPEGWPESITGSTDLFYSDADALRYGGSISDGVLSVIQDVMANPVVNAEAAWFVGHRMDYSEPWEDWDFTRWTAHGLEMTDENFPGNYGGDINRSFDGEPPTEDGPPAEEAPLPWHQVEVPDDFKNAVTALSEWDDQTRNWGLGSGQQDLALKYVYNRFVNGFDGRGYAWGGLDTFDDAGNPVYNEGTINDFLEYGQGGGATVALTEIQGVFDSGMFGPAPESPADYIPTSQIGALPEGWLSFWAEDDPTIGQWWEHWEGIFEENRQREVGQYAWDDLEQDFLADLEKQGWWIQHGENYRRLAQFWYSGGGPGGMTVDGEWTPGAGYEIPPVDRDWSTGTYRGTGDWAEVWDARIEGINSIAEDLGLYNPNTGFSTLRDSDVNAMAWMLMRDGGAANFYHPTSTWADTAASKVERYIIDNFFDENGNPTVRSIVDGEVTSGLASGSIQDIVDQLRARANSQLYEVDGGDDTLRQWALEIKSERGPNLAQRMAQIDNAAYAEWGLSTEQIDGMGEWSEFGSPGASVSSLVNPLWKAATGVGEDGSYLKEDEWLMDNYQEVNAEDGTKRFRTAQEMRNLARTNLDRFQHSKQYQTPLNNFIRGAAAMFRSDY